MKHKRGDFTMVLVDLFALLLIITLFFVYSYLFRTVDVSQDRSVRQDLATDHAFLNVLSYLRTPVSSSLTVADLLIAGCSRTEQSTSDSFVHALPFTTLTSFTPSLPLPSSLGISVLCKEQTYVLKKSTCTPSEQFFLPSSTSTPIILRYCGDVR